MEGNGTGQHPPQEPELLAASPRPLSLEEWARKQSRPMLRLTGNEGYFC